MPSERSRLRLCLEGERENATSDVLKQWEGKLLPDDSILLDAEA